MDVFSFEKWAIEWIYALWEHLSREFAPLNAHAETILLRAHWGGIRGSNSIHCYNYWKKLPNKLSLTSIERLWLTSIEWRRMKSIYIHAPDWGKKMSISKTAKKHLYRVKTVVRLFHEKLSYLQKKKHVVLNLFFCNDFFSTHLSIKHEHIRFLHNSWSLGKQLKIVKELN